LPPRFVAVIVAFAPLFRQRRTWAHARALLTGALLATGARTVASALRALGRAGERRFVTYHRVLSRAAWSPRAASRVLLRLLIETFVPAGPLVFALDDTLERRKGKHIAARGVYRDPVRSGPGHFVKATGLRWLSVMVLAPIPWAGRVWALPVLTALAPSERYYTSRHRRHKPLTTWARQLLRQLARWCRTLAPGRPLIAVADQSFAALPLLAALAPTLTCITRLRLDAALYAPLVPLPPGARRPRGRPPRLGPPLPKRRAVLTDPATAWTRVRVAEWYGAVDYALDLVTGVAVWHRASVGRVPLRWVLVRDPAARFAAQAVLCTDPTRAPTEILQYYARRWTVEVTFAEARRHLGVESQRQWSDQAIARTTPILLGLVSLVTLLATRLVPAGGTLPVRTAAWYAKPTPTFSDALAAVRAQWWTRTLF
jgi:hypothetical protein